MNEWINRWAGSYTFISCSYWGPQYFRALNKILGKGFDTTLFIHKKGTVSFLVKKDELDDLGNFLAKKVQEDKEGAAELLNKLKDNTNIIMDMMDKLSGKIINLEEYSEFMNVFERHLAYHVFMKKTVDYLPKELLNEMFPKFKDTRIYSEPVYSRTEEFFRELAKAIGEKENIEPELLTCLTQDEIERYISKQILPKENILKERYNFSVLSCEKDNLKILTGEAAINLEKEILNNKLNDDMIKGSPAYPGTVKGRCRIVLDPFAKVEFEQGEILVTGMTRPDFVKFMEKASAIVTDAGGVLCHAAITAREMKIPTIVGTEIGTKVFKDGDIIEVDAENGVVRKISK
ncbi:MAG: PEP-utilizing enzyme [Candidatus Woesearchaeota archaeon]